MPPLILPTSSLYILLSSLLFLADYAASIPRRGNEPWSLILCKFKDMPRYEPRTKEWFEQWLSGSNSESIESYFAQISNGVYTIAGSAVHGWYTINYTQKEVMRLANTDPTLKIGSDSSFDVSLALFEHKVDGTAQYDLQYFDKIKELCVQTAAANGAQLRRQKITVINAGTTAVYGKVHGVLITPQLMFTSVLTHEMVHSFYIGHSYSDRKIRIFPYALRGEYDDRYDLMSTANAYMHRSRFGMSGPGLNGPHLDFLGWLPMDRILYFGRDGRQNYTLRLSSLSVPHSTTRGWLLVMIPFDRNDPRNFFTVELRTPNNYDKGITMTSVLIHRVQKAADSSYYSILLSQAKDYYELTENTEWVKFLEPDSTGRFQLIRVTVRRLYPHDADITVVSTFEPTECRRGETRKPIAEQQLGVATVCVEGTREPTEADVQLQFARKNFYSVRNTFGANACRAGRVWRAIDAYDYVCVEPFRRDVIHEEVQHQENRLSLNGTGCAEPFLTREAFPGDSLCVTPTEKFLTQRENVQSVHHLEHFAFFNGVDAVGP